jgi:phage shock protein C
MRKRLQRKRLSTLAGVCSGLANYFNIDPIIVRALFIILALTTTLPIVLAYIILWILMPEEINGLE